MTQKAPALFIGHGSPMNALEDNAATQGWRAIAARFPRPRAIVCVSAHWLTEGVRVTSNQHPRTIHDFGGFPPELFALRYPAAGDPELARDVVRRLSAFGAESDESWGLDHGAWSVLIHLFPSADTPVIQLSLDARRNPAQHLAIALALAPLRDDNVLILGSGNIVHNLRAFFRRDAGTPDHAAAERAFDDFIVSAIAERDHDAILNYKSHPDAARAAPDWDHFFPLFYALGAQGEGERAETFNRHTFPGISMTSIAIGAPEQRP